jgi:hypothetical protein
MTLSDEVLMAYTDGELDPQTRARVEEAIASDPQVARRVAAHEALREKVQSTFGKVLDEPVPDRLIRAARASTGRVIPLRPKRFQVSQWGALAASFVLGALVWQLAIRLYSTGPIIERHGQLLAAGALDSALSNQLAGDPSTQSAVQIGVSFRSKGGRYCRTFQLREQANLAGLACRQQSQWQLEVLDNGSAAHEGHPEYQPAASALPPEVVQAVDRVIDGEPLDAEGEARAKQRGWLISR